VKKVICCLSTCIFPDDVEYPLLEDMIHLCVVYYSLASSNGSPEVRLFSPLRGAPHPSSEGYSYAKRMMEVQCRLYREAYGMNCVSIIPVRQKNRVIVPARFCTQSACRSSIPDKYIWEMG
jgi:GDP-L-fucose synthase